MSTGKADLRAQLVGIFREEAGEHLAAIAQELTDLATADPSAARAGVERLFRITHTLKGAARSVSFTAIEQACHEVEDLCADLVHGRAPLTDTSRTELAALCDALAEATDRALADPALSPASAPMPAQETDAPAEATLSRADPPPAAAEDRPEAEPPPADSPATPGSPPDVPAESASPPAPPPVPARPTPPADPAPLPPARPAAAPSVVPSPAPPPAAPARPAPARPTLQMAGPSGSGFVRLEAGQLQRLGQMAEDLLPPRLAAGARADEARRLHARLLHVRRGTSARAPLSGDASSSTRGTELQRAEEDARRLAGALAGDNRTLRGLIDTLMVELRRARMMPASDMLAVFPGMVAELAASLGRAVRLHIAGDALLIDRQVANRLKDPLIHIVRNAVDHGIESPAKRRDAGKLAEGMISLTIEPADGGRLAFEIADDGAGIDLAAVRAAAVRARLLSPASAATLGPDELRDLVFQSNLSTRTVISATSGRGLGLAIVRTQVERLGGSVELRSTPGIGTVLRLEVPGALANFRGLGVRVGGVDHVWPRDSVERALSLPPEALAAARARGVVPMDGALLPFGSLARVLGYPEDAPEQDPRTEASGLGGCLLIRHGNRRGLVAVDDITGDCEVVVKELRPPLLRVRHVLAAGLLGNGRLALILRAADVLETLALPRDAAPPPPRPPLPRGRIRLLVVDDSLTTRAMEAGLLEAAGYEVETAADGMDAWALLQTRPFDAVVSDVDMPRLDGFALTGRIRADARLKQLPIVLVTAMETREDHDRGLALGANAYVLKSAFDQTLLIDLVRRVL